MDKACVALSMKLHTAVDYFKSLPYDELCETATMVVDYEEAVRRAYGQK